MKDFLPGIKKTAAEPLGTAADIMKLL